MDVWGKFSFLLQHCFQQFHQTKFLAYCLGIFAVSVGSFWVLLRIRRYGGTLFLGKCLLINAEKSGSSALQVGGLPFSVISVAALGVIFWWFPYLMGPNQWLLLEYALFSWVGILIYGYFDDRYELRSIVKLASQVGIVGLFCLRAAYVVAPADSATVFLLMTLFATVILNGANLLDGLDTISFKTSTFVYFTFLVLAANIACLPALFVASACFFIMLGFYPYNRSPSRIHLGEVGVCCLGFSYVLLAVLIFDGYRALNPPLSAASKALLPVVPVMAEVLVSFLRRLLTGRSPFRGDKLHVHQLLVSAYGLRPANAATVVALAQGSALIGALWLVDVSSSIVAFFALSAVMVGWAIIVGHRHWRRRTGAIQLFNAFLVREEVLVLSPQVLKDFRVIVPVRRD
jgi:UDP-GlcNAc:undecaprenyl-phosphate GlcNAc-1-phosphate transferase